MDKLHRILEANATLRARAGQPTSPVARSTWDRVVGPRIAARSEPYRLERGILLVRVASSAWANELSLLSEPIVEQLRAQGIEVTAVRFVVGDVSLSPRRTRGPAGVVPPRDAPIPAALVAVLEHVPSAALRHALAEAAAKSMALAEAAAERFGRRGSGSTSKTAKPTAGRATPAPATTAPRWMDRARESVLPAPPDGPGATARRDDEQHERRREELEDDSVDFAHEPEEPDD